MEQNTLHFDPATGVTSPLRSKEDAHDYRYFPDPDLPPIVLDAAYVEQVRAQMPPLPQELFEQFTKQYSLSEYDAALLAEEKPVALYFVEFCRHTPHFKAAANLIINKILPWRDENKAGIEAYPVAQERLAAMLELVSGGQLSNTVAWQNLLPALMAQPEQSALELAQTLGLLQTNDEDFLLEIIDQALAANPNKVAEYQKGKKGLQGFFMGEIMRLSKGKADPKAVTPLLLKKLDAS